MTRASSETSQDETSAEAEAPEAKEKEEEVVAPEAGADAEPAKAESVDTLLRRFLSLPPIQVTAPPPPDSLIDRNASTLPAPGKSPKLEQLDQQVAEIEPLLATSNWAGVIEVLKKQEALPPPLALLYAVALKERGEQGDAQGLAIRSVAALLCVPENSETALVIAKRLLRTNPVTWKERRAPSAGISIGIVLVVVLLGALVGALLGPGTPLLR